jgi:hypothetical protein
MHDLCFTVSLVDCQSVRNDDIVFWKTIQWKEQWPNRHIFTKGNVIQWFVMLCFILHLGAAAEIIVSTLSGQKDSV